MSAIDAAGVKGFACFAGLSDADAGAVAEHLEPVSLSAGQTLFPQGAQENDVYLVKSGQVEIKIKAGAGDRVLTTLEPGAILGEIALLQGSARTAAAVAKTPAELYKISANDFHSSLERGDKWASKFLLATALALAGRMSALDKELTRLIEEQPTERKGELTRLRESLLRNWSF
jgi:CRP-like cAMP-binding protein